MKINIFEGARRITKLIAVIWVVGWCFYTFMEKVYVHSYFSVNSPYGVVGTPIMSSTPVDCKYAYGTEKAIELKTSSGYDVNATLCFLPYIDYKDKDLEWAEVHYVSQVEIQKAATNFKLSKEDDEWFKVRIWDERVERIELSIVGLAFLWIFSWSVGWIVRGFAGIPSGQDRM